MRPWRAFFIAPLAVPLVYWAERLSEAAADPARRDWALSNGLSGLLIVVVFSAPVAYAATVAAGVPLFMLGRRQRLRLSVTVIVGVVLGAIVGALLEPQLRGDLFSVPVGPWRGALLGGAAATVWHRLLAPSGA